MFEKASRMKLRFETVKGIQTVEDLWDLPLTSENGISLDGIARKLKKELRDIEDESFVVPRSSKTESTLNLKFDIVKYIIDTKVQESEDRKALSKRKAEKDKILEIIAMKENDALLGKSLDELKKMIDA